MHTTSLNYITNLFRIVRNNRVLAPLVVSYCVTTHCNLNCRYCEDFGARRNAEQPDPLPLADAQRLLRIIREATNSLILTGGEPLLYPEIDALVDYARHDLGFHTLSMISNGVLLAQKSEVLSNLHRLIISLDSVDPSQWDLILRAEPGTAARILDNVTQLAKAKVANAQLPNSKATDYPTLIIHCVLTPQTLSSAYAVLDFCLEHQLIFSFSPQSFNNWPHYDLLTSESYHDFVAHMIQYKKEGAPILGSMAYLTQMYNFIPYACYPLLAPRVMSDGTLSYPCRPIERSGNTHGGRGVNLLEVNDWDTALDQAVVQYGHPPMTCGSCYQQCYVEPSLMQARPLAWLREWLTCAASRRGRLLTYAPG